MEKYLKKENRNWEYKKLENVDLEKEIKPLFIRQDQKKIEEEIKNLNNLT